MPAVSVPMIGNVSERPFPGLLWALHGTQVTGRVALDDDSGWKSTIFLRQGAPVCVDLPEQTDRLDKVLVDAGMVTPRQLRDLETTRLATGRRLGDLLTGAGLIPRAKLTQALKLQLTRKLIRLFVPQQASFALTVGNHPFGIGEDFAAMTVHPRSIVYPGIRASYDLQRLDREISVLRDRSFRLSKAATTYLAQMGFRRDDEAVLGALWQRALDISDLGSVDATPTAARSVVLSLFYTELLDLGPRVVPELPPLVTRSPSSAAGMPDRIVVSVPPRIAAPHSLAARVAGEGAARIAVPAAALKVAAAAAAAAAPGAAALAATLRADIQALDAKLDSLDHFEVLGLRRDAREDAINGAFVQAAKRFHPDRARALGVTDVADAAGRIMARVAEANMVLTDPKKRVMYQRNIEVGAADRAQALAVLDAEVHFQDGEQLLRRGDFANAEAAFAHAVEGNPSEPQHRGLLAWARFANPKANKDQVLPESLKALQIAIHERPTWARGHYFLGLLWKHKGEMPRAKGAFQAALNEEPRFFDAERELRLISMRAKK